jgi:hypothetical protein
MTDNGVTDRPIAEGDVVTVHTGSRQFDVTEINGDLARLWPVIDSDDSMGKWVGVGLLHRVDRPQPTAGGTP